MQNTALKTNALYIVRKNPTMFNLISRISFFDEKVLVRELPTLINTIGTIPMPIPKTKEIS